jgi:hypothetical protein
MEEQTAAVESRLRKEAAFESMFSRTNLEQGLHVWAKSTGVVFVISIALNLLGIYSLLGSFLPLALFILSFYLLQIAVSAEGTKRYKFTAERNAWWSTYWRVIVYILPVTFVFVFLLPGDLRGMQPEEMMNSNAMVFANAIILLVSIIPTGISTSKALLISYLKQQKVN